MAFLSLFIAFFISLQVPFFAAGTLSVHVTPLDIMVHMDSSFVNDKIVSPGCFFLNLVTAFASQFEIIDTHSSFDMKLYLYRILSLRHQLLQHWRCLRVPVFIHIYKIGRKEKKTQEYVKLLISGLPWNGYQSLTQIIYIIIPK